MLLYTGALSSSKTMNKNRMEIKCNEAYGQVSSFLHNSSTPVLPVLSTSQILSMQDNQCYGQSQIQVSESDEINLRENVCYSQAKDSVFVQENVSYSEAKTAPIYESLLYWKPSLHVFKTFYLIPTVETQIISIKLSITYC